MAMLILGCPLEKLEASYDLSKPEWNNTCDFPTIKVSNKDFVAESVTFHHLVVKMKADLHLELARDFWV
jgi:hypothetical protein